MKKIVALICFFALSINAFAQDDAFAKDVRTCIKSNGTIGYYEDVIDRMFTMLEKQFEGQKVPVTLWAELKGEKIPAMDELAVMITSAYKAHFSHKDVKNMNKLYTSKAGKAMFKTDKLSESDKMVLEEFYKSETGKKITGSQDSMNESMGKISKLWSRQLYRRIIDKLSEKGFNL